MTLPRPLMLGLIVILALILGWASYDELRRRETLANQNSQMSTRATPTLLTSATPNPTELSSGTLQLEPTLLSTPSSITSGYSSTPTSVATPSSNTATLVNNQTSPTAPATTPSTTPEEVPVCSSFDQAGLLATFDASLVAFIANATVTYGDQYANLQYQLSSKIGTITGEQGTVTTEYSGTVQELSTGAPVSANGIITANFAWDGCVWQLVDYSF